MSQIEKTEDLEKRSKTYLAKEHFVVAGIFGKHEELGEGKTLLLTYISNLQHLKGELVYSNYTLPFSEEFTNLGMLSKIKNCFLAIDDIIPLMESRESQKHILSTWILNTCRKREIKLVYSAQIKSAVEYRLRKISQLVIQTSLIQFPSFHIKIYNSSGEQQDEFKITYQADILDLYETLEIVYQRIALKELIALTEEVNKKRTFQTITRAKYSFAFDLAGSVYDLLGLEKYDLLRDTLESYGYQIT